MAKMFYQASEAAEILGRTEAQLTDLVREGKLREFRDGDTINYKVGDVDGLVGSLDAAALDDSASASASGDIVLEIADDSGIELSESSGDVISLADTDPGDSDAAATAVKDAKEGTVVPSVGINVFDDDELDEQVDPLAQTAITDVAGLGIEGTGSGSGILDLTRESDDTSFGSELLEEIYTGDEDAPPAVEDEGTIEMGDATRAGLDEAIPEGSTEDEDALAVDNSARTGADLEPGAVETAAVTRQVVEFRPDAVSASLTALMVVAVPVMLVAGLAAASLARGVFPSLLETAYSNLWIFAVGSAVVGGLAAGGTYFMAKRSAK